MYKKNIINAMKFAAVGDAIGYKFEFSNHVTPDDVDNMIAMVINGNHSPLNFSDDTQMTLFLYESLYSNDDWTTRGVFDKTVMSYIDWFKTQNGHRKLDAQGLLSHECMYERRAPGLTCLSSIEHIIEKNQLPVNDSKGCGSVMRILPFASLIGADIPYDEIVDMAIMSGYITHSHAENEEAIRLYMDTARYLLTNEISRDVYGRLMSIADRKRITDLGEGWTALECVEMGIWAAFTALSATDCVIRVVAHPGDSDSTGMVACSLFGMSNNTGMVVREFIGELYKHVLPSDERAAIEYVLNTTRKVVYENV